MFKTEYSIVVNAASVWSRAISLALSLKTGKPKIVAQIQSVYNKIAFSKARGIKDRGPAALEDLDASATKDDMPILGLRSAENMSKTIKEFTPKEVLQNAKTAVDLILFIILSRGFSFSCCECQTRSMTVSSTHVVGVRMAFMVILKFSWYFGFFELRKSMTNMR